jgi:hypothetical protein
MHVIKCRFCGKPIEFREPTDTDPRSGYGANYVSPTGVVHLGFLAEDPYTCTENDLLRHEPSPPVPLGAMGGVDRSVEEYAMYAAHRDSVTVVGGIVQITIDPDGYEEEQQVMFAALVALAAAYTDKAGIALWATLAGLEENLALESGYGASVPRPGDE